MNIPPSDTFDLLTLLKSGDMIMSVINAKDSQLTLQRFFNKVERFMQTTPAFIECLHDIAIIRSRTSFLNDLASYKKIQADIDTYFLNETKAFKDMLIDLGAIKFIDVFLELEMHVRNGDFYKRDEVLLRLTHHISGLHSRTKRAHLRQDMQDTHLAYDPNALLSDTVRKLEEQERARRRRILLVDDMPTILNAISAVMSQIYDVYTLSNGNQVLKFLQFNDPPDVFLLDIEMPGMDGFTVFNLIRQQKEYAKTPIIFLSGHMSEKVMQTAMSMGAADFLTKPINQILLHEAIQNNLPRRMAAW